MLSSVLILAAGIGSRLKSETPKVYHKIGGLSLADHVITAAKGINPCKIAIVLNPAHKVFKFKYSDDVLKTYQETQKGTADAVKCGLDALSTDSGTWVYVLYGDIPLITAETLLKMSEIAQKCSNTAVVVAAINASGTNGLGMLESGDTEGTIKSIIEAKDSMNSKKMLPLCNAGMLIRKDVLKKLLPEIKPSPITGEFYITEIVRSAHETGYVCRYVVGNSDELTGVNTRAELAVLEKNFQDRERKKHLDNGVTLVAPETVFFSYDTRLENDVTVHPYVVFSENVFIEKGTQVGPFCVVEGADIKKSAQVGPFSRLRPGTVIRDEAKIGNFVEVKNSIISEKTKVNHLTYIGDSQIGKNTNIGAGTVTCNYDGTKKHKTVIGENVFVGSNTSLIAPLEICDDTTIGAGSVITENVAEGELAIARSEQKNIKNRSRKIRKDKKCAE